MGASERRDLVHQPARVHLVASCADVVTLLLVELGPDEGGDELIPAHADRAVNPPQREHDVVATERAVPRERVVDVSFRPRTTSASTSIHGAWQIAATGLPASRKERTNPTAFSSVRSVSGLPTPPGSSSAS